MKITRLLLSFIAVRHRWCWVPTAALAGCFLAGRVAGAPPAFLRLVPVGAPATCAAVHEPSGQLVVGHHALEGQQLSLFRLDELDGEGARPAVRLALPAAGLPAGADHLPLALAFHPRLPLLYVWQDYRLPAEAAPPGEDFRHLLVYLVGRGRLVLLAEQGRGGAFRGGQGRGALALSADGRRLFLPNLDARGPAVGYYRLNSQGLPFGEGADATVTVAGLGGLSDGYPTGVGFAAGTGAAVILAGSEGFITWDTGNHLARFALFPLENLPRVNALGAHPTQAVAYLLPLGGNRLHWMRHADGYLTLLPGRLEVSGARFRSGPLVFAPENILLAGGENRLYLVSLDERGYPDGPVSEEPVAAGENPVFAVASAPPRVYVMTVPD